MQPPSILGSRQGTLDADTAKLRLAFHILANNAGGFTATLDSLNQNARGIAVQETTYANRKLTMKMATLRAAFESTLNAGGKSGRTIAVRPGSS